MRQRHRHFWALSLVCNFLLHHIALATPVFMPQFLTGGTGRNIRHLPCVSRRTGETGVCMFAFTCAKANGTHLGTCIDRFYFGSCCKLEDEPDIFPQDNTIDVDNPLSLSKPFLTTSTTQSVESNDIPGNVDKLKPTLRPVLQTAASVITKATEATTTTSRITEQPAKTKPSKIATKKPMISFEATTESIRLSTFQTVQNASDQRPTTESSTTAIAAAVAAATKRPQQRPSVPNLKPSTSTRPRPTTTPILSSSIPANSTVATSDYILTSTKSPSTSFNRPASHSPTTTTSGYLSSHKRPTVAAELTKRPSSPAATTTPELTETTRPSFSSSTGYRNVSSSSSSFPTTTAQKAPSTDAATRPTSTAATTQKKPPATRFPPRNATTTGTFSYTTTTETSHLPSSLATSAVTNKVEETTLKPSNTRKPVTTKKPIKNTTKRPSNATKRPSSTITRRPPPTVTKHPTTTSTTATRAPITATIPSATTITSSGTTIPSTNTSSTTANITRKPVTTLPTKRPSFASTRRPSPTTTTPSPPRITSTVRRPTITSSKKNVTSSSSARPTTSGSTPTKLPITTRRPAVTAGSSSAPTPAAAAAVSSTTTKTQTKLELTTTTKPTTLRVTTLKPTEKPIKQSTAAATLAATATIPSATTVKITIPTTTTTTTSRPTIASTTLEASTKPVTQSPTTTTSVSSSPITIRKNVTTSSSATTATTVTMVSNDIDTELDDNETDQTTMIPGLVTWTSLSDDAAEISTKTPEYSSILPDKPDTTETDWTPITTPDGWIIIQSPTTEKESEEDLEIKPITSTTKAPSVSAKPTGSSTATMTATRRPPTMTTTTTTQRITTQPTTYVDMLSTLATVTVSPDFTQSAFPPINMSNFKDVCGRRLFPESRIVGGDGSTFGKWPWQISLRQWRTSTYLHKCGAALLNENWAITAAHCVQNVLPSDLLLRIGEHDLGNEEEPYGFQERRVQIVASHPNFDPRTFEFDLALMRFYEPILPFQPNVLPICIPDDDEEYVGQTAFVTGWGRLYEDGPLPSVLQEVAVPVINNSVCEGMYRNAGYIEHIPHIFICAGWRKGGFDSCEGDSGGPLVIQRKRDKRWVLAGVISWGIGCAEPNQPGVYTRISEFREWINQILQF